MSQFKPGDLALVIASRTGLNIGKTVKLDRFVTKGEEIHLSGWTLFCTCDSWLATGDLLTKLGSGRVLQTAQHGFREKCLMPLQGNFQPEQQKSLEVVE